MDIISQARLEIARHRFPDLLQNIVAHVLSDKREAMREAIENKNSEKFNEIVSQALQQYLGSSNLEFGLERFCAKFGIEKDFSAMGPANIILFIASRSADFEKKLNEASQMKGEKI